MIWRLLADPAGRTGAENMATDQALLEAVARAPEPVAFLRLYRWSPPCLSFGRHEPAERRYDRAAIERLGLDTVRRPSGGRAVWHEAEVTYAVAGPAEMFGALPDAYITIHRVLCSALRRLGAPAALAPRPPGRAAGPASGACFAAAAGGEVVVGDRKLVGSAQLRTDGAFLQHGSILLEDAQDVVARVTVGGSGPVPAASLEAALGRRVTFADVVAVVSAEAARAWGGAWEPADPRRLAPAPGRFADPAWTWRR